MSPGPIRVVVAGTGTGVGKTELTAALLQDALRIGHGAVGLKPLETGPVAEADSARLGAACGRRVEPFFRFVDPVSPHLAARRAGRTLAAAGVADWVIAHSADCAIVETAGGLFSPISDTEVNFDWIARVPWTRHVLVCPGRLGVLHDVGAVLRAAPALPWSVLVVSAVEGVESASLQATELARVVLPQVGRSFPVRVWDAAAPSPGVWDWLNL